MSDPRDFQQQFKYLMGVARSQGLNTMDAEDVVSSAVLSLLETYPGQVEALRAAGRVTVNRKIIDSQRSWNSRRPIDEKVAGLASHNAAAPAEAVMLEKATEDEVSALRRAVVESTDEGHRPLDGALFDVALECLTPHETTAAYDAIGLRYGLNPRGLKSRMEKVRRRMRQLYLQRRPWAAV